MAKIKVELVTPEKKIASAQVDEAIIPGFHGLFGVRPGHTPFLSIMEPGALILKDAGTTETYFVTAGFVEVANDVVLVLADQAEPAGSIDVADSQRKLNQAQERLKGMSQEDVRFDIETATVKTETARMAVAARLR